MFQLTKVQIFNALSNAKHIFALKEEGTVFQVLEVVKTEESVKAVIFEKETGEISGLFTDSKSAMQGLLEIKSTFENDQPFIKANIKQTPKGLSVYYFTIEE